MFKYEIMNIIITIIIKFRQCLTIYDTCLRLIQVDIKVVTNLFCLF